MTGKQHKRRKRRSNCPISYALDMFGDKWTLIVVRDLMFKGKQRYGELLASPERIATNMLADRLETLQENGIVRVTPDPKRVGGVLYHLTEKGIALVPVLVEMICWSAKHDPDTATDKAFLKSVAADRDGLIHAIQHRLRAGPI
jgi:DNA-binding HxlR family transcriptional regulator